MAYTRLPMRKIKEVLRLKFSCGLTERRIAASVGTARSTIGDYLRRAAKAGVSWPLPPDLTDEQLESKRSTPRKLSHLKV